MLAMGMFWGVFWRSGGLTRSPEVHEMHGLADNETLMGWLYVGGVTGRTKPDNKHRVRVDEHLSVL